MGVFAPEATTWWERLSTMRRPARERIAAGRALRRVAAVVAVLGYGLLLLATRVDVGLPPALTGLAWGLLLVAWAGSVVVVLEFRRRLANAADGALDERELRLRDRAFLQAHRLSATTVFVVAAVVSVWPRADTAVALTTHDVVNALVGLAMALLLLPAAIVAWQEPDDGPDDDVDALLPPTAAHEQR